MMGYMSRPNARPERITTLLRKCCFGAAVALAVPGGGQAVAQSPIKILVTNDDGINSEGIAALVEALKPMAEVVVSAPAENQSGAGQSVTLFDRPLRVTESSGPDHVRRVAVHGTPADSAIFGLLHHGGDRPFDLVTRLL